VSRGRSRRGEHTAVGLKECSRVCKYETAPRLGAPAPAMKEGKRQPYAGSNLTARGTRVALERMTSVCAGGHMGISTSTLTARSRFASGRVRRRPLAALALVAALSIGCASSSVRPAATRAEPHGTHRAPERSKGRPSCGSGKAAIGVERKSGTMDLAFTVY
jgi:hypothetical protein